MSKAPVLISDISEIYDWIIEHELEKDDILVEQLPSPEMLINGNSVVSFCSNNYLGLANRNRIITASTFAVNKYGNGTCESRRLGGNLELLERLEKKIASFKKEEDSIIFATGILANIGTIPALADSLWYSNKFYGKKYNNVSNTIILTDSKNHRSIQMGISLSKAESIKYKHCDMEDLEKLLERNKTKKILVITDSVFSMNGNLAPLDKIAELCKRYYATVMIDDAHATGIFGQHGRGLTEHFNVEKDIHIKMGTLSKSLGGLGGFVASTEKVVKILKLTASTYYFTSSLPASQAAGLIEAFNLIQAEPPTKVSVME